MQTLKELVTMIQHPGDNLVDNETLFRLLQIDAEHARLIENYKAMASWVSRALPVFKLMKSYNPAHPMAPGMRAQYEQLMAELENNG
jgi:hypothetical protein